MMLGMQMPRVTSDLMNEMLFGGDIRIQPNSCSRVPVFLVKRGDFV